MATTAPTASFARDQRRAVMTAQSTQRQQNHGESVLLPSDDMVPAYKIYIYNILELKHVRKLPPNFPSVVIPACLPNEKFAFTTMPPLVRNRFNKTGTFEYYYQVEDGRKSAMQLLNPASFPSIDFDRQLVANSQEIEYEVSGSNLNQMGVWWSLTRPQDTEQLDKEIALFREVVIKKMNSLAKTARAWGSDQKKVLDITPRMHFAMDYLHLKAPWHVDTYAMINCPTCGEEVRQGIVYHHNSMGDRCIVDLPRAQKLGIAAPAEFVGEQTKEPPAITSTGPFDVHEIIPEQSEEEIRDEENTVIAAARAIMEKRQKAAIDKRKATVAAKKNTLNADKTADVADVAKVAESGPYQDPPKPDEEGFGG